MNAKHFFPIFVLILSGCNSAGPDSGSAQDDSSLLSNQLANPTAYIPAQCYTRTEDDSGGVHNPCYTCHINSRPPNQVNDVDLQLSYSFPGPAQTNPWSNLFRDRRADMAAIADDTVDSYVRTGNYFADGGDIALARLAREVPEDWDYNGNGQWDGFVPDVRFDFDSEGFDRTPDGGYSGWRAFAYYPFLGTFFPANGSTDDVLIRLPEIFRLNGEGRFDAEAYKLNLAIVESLIKREDVAIDPVDEQVWQVDLNQDGILGVSNRVVFRWDVTTGRLMEYVGAARQPMARGEVHIAPGLYPEGTEFVHTVRYLDIREDGSIGLSARLKELRYARKRSWLNYHDLEKHAFAEAKERHDFPDRLKQIIGNPEEGVSNGKGWNYQGFIESADGALRPQTFEEHAFCVGCHSGLGATTDDTFAMARKFPADSFQQGWYHWSQKGLAGIAEPRRSDGEPEYGHYLQQNGSASEFRNNPEVQASFFHTDGTPKSVRLKLLEQDISLLLLPSPERARALNKAYWLIVQEQSFSKGRDPVLEPVTEVWRELDSNLATGITRPVVSPWK